MRKRNPQINATVTPDLEQVISERAAALHLTKSKFVSLLIEKWEADGCPPISPADAITALKQDRSKKRAS